MARTGVSKLDVLNARNSVLGKGGYPSVDNVRAALGFTGSKTTISKYLKELALEEPLEHAQGAPLQPVLSDKLTELVSQLMLQLSAEARRELETFRQSAQDKAHEAEAATAGLEAQLREQAKELAQSKHELQESRQEVLSLSEQLALGRHQLDLNHKDLVRTEALLVSAENHSADMKHRATQAQQSLEHFREASKTQREQDLQRHDQELMSVRSELQKSNQTVVLLQEQKSLATGEVARLAALYSTEQATVQKHNEQLMSLSRTLSVTQASENAAKQDVATLLEARSAQAQVIEQHGLLLAEKLATIHEQRTLLSTLQTTIEDLRATLRQRESEKELLALEVASRPAQP